MGEATVTANELPAELEALRARVLATPCPDGRRPIFSAGSATARLVIVGEGGPAGDLLFRARGEAGIRQEDVWLTNVLKCRLLKQQDGRWVNRPPTDAELTAAMPVLDEELALLRPAAVLCLGATAARALLGKTFKFTTERGRWFPTLNGWRVLATYLPAYVLRREGPDFDEAYAAMLADFRTVAESVNVEGT
jgi:uracil-DNA glycosylase